MALDVSLLHNHGLYLSLIGHDWYNTESVSSCSAGVLLHWVVRSLGFITVDWCQIHRMWMFECVCLCWTSDFRCSQFWSLNFWSFSYFIQLVTTVRLYQCRVLCLWSIITTFISANQRRPFENLLKINLFSFAFSSSYNFTITAFYVFFC